MVQDASINSSNNSTDPQKEKKNYSQALLLAASAGILLMQGVTLLRKPQKVAADDSEKIVAKISELGEKFVELSKKVDVMASQNEKINQTVNESVTKSALELVEKIKEIIAESANLEVSQKMQQTLDGALEKLAKMETTLSGVDKKTDDASGILTKIYSELQEARKEVLKMYNVLQVSDIDFKNGIAYSKITKKPFDGILEHTDSAGACYELTYLNGKLIKSEKFDASGNWVSRKTYSTDSINKGDFLEIAKIKTEYASSPISDVMITTKTIEEDGSRKIKSLTRTSRDSQAKTMTEKMKFVKNKDGAGGFMLDGTKEDLRYIKMGNDKKIIKEVKNLPLEHEAEMSDSGDGFTIFKIKLPSSKNNPTKD